MTLILGAPLARAGVDVVALDNLGYGLTDVAQGANPGYGDWVRLVLAFLAEEASRDARPTVLYGLSAGLVLQNTHHNWNAVLLMGAVSYVAGVPLWLAMDPVTPLEAPSAKV